MRVKKLVSVIVPIYNVEKYLKKCVESLINQTYECIEIILVDDGSPDDSGYMCDEYAKKDERIKVIHKKNGGLSSARNAGLDVANGDYIGFVDSDDWVEPNMYNKLVEMLETNDCDLVECGVNLARECEIVGCKKGKDKVFKGCDALKLHLEATGNNYIPRVAVWSKLYRREFWEKRRFPEGKVHEDYMLTCEALYEAKRVGVCYTGLYNHFVENETSIMNSSFGKKDLYLETQYQKRVEYLREKKEYELAEIAERNYYMLLVSLYWRCCENDMEEQSYYLKLLKDSKRRVKELKLPKKRYIEYLMIVSMPIVYRAMRKIYNRNMKMR